MNFGKRDNEIVQMCDELLKSKNPLIVNSKFKQLLSKIFLEEDCYISQITNPDWKNTFISKITLFKAKEFPNEFVQEKPEQNEIMQFCNLAKNAESSYNWLTDKIGPLITNYKELQDLIDG